LNSISVDRFSGFKVCKKAEIFSTFWGADFNLPFFCPFIPRAATSYSSFVPVHIDAWKKVSEVFSSVVQFVFVLMVDMLAFDRWKHHVVHVDGRVFPMLLPRASVSLRSNPPSVFVQSLKKIVVDQNFTTICSQNNLHVDSYKRCLKRSQYGE